MPAEAECGMRETDVFLLLVDVAGDAVDLVERCVEAVVLGMVGWRVLLQGEQQDLVPRDALH